MFVLVDNYDSFTFNLFHFLGEVGAQVEVVRNDATTAQALVDRAPEGIILSPGPCDPDRAGICLDLVARAAGQLPILGVCLGHQTIGQAFGGRIVRAPLPMHGKVDRIQHDGHGIFAGIPSPFAATRYHSLVIAPDSVPPTLEVTATTADGVIMGVQHRQFPVFGVQFHPESIATEHGRRLIGNFVDIARRRNAPQGDAQERAA